MRLLDNRFLIFPRGLMTERQAVYLEAYLSAHNECLSRHPNYRPDMKFTFGSPRGAFVLHTRDPEISEDDVRLFEEVLGEVAAAHQLVVT